MKPVNYDFEIDSIFSRIAIEPVFSSVSRSLLTLKIKELNEAKPSDDNSKSLETQKQKMLSYLQQKFSQVCELFDTQPNGYQETIQPLL